MGTDNNYIKIWCPGPCAGCYLPSPTATRIVPTDTLSDQPTHLCVVVKGLLMRVHVAAEV